MLTPAKLSQRQSIRKHKKTLAFEQKMGKVFTLIMGYKFYTCNHIDIYAITFILLVFQMVILTLFPIIS